MRASIIIIRFIAYILVLTASCLRCRASSRSRFGRGWAGLDLMSLASIDTFDSQVAGETHTLETLARDRSAMMAKVRDSSLASASGRSTDDRNFVLDIIFLVGDAVHGPGRRGKLPRPA